MPAHLAALHRRRFLAATGTGWLACAACSADEPRDRDLVYLLNDTHIGGRQPTDSPVPTHLRQVVDEVTARERPPAALLINGDLALRDGQVDDYEHFARLIDPLMTADIDLHLTLGNHDHREHFYRVMADRRPEAPVVASRHVGMVATQHANFFLLDSLQETMVTPGTLGAEQRRWLAAALDQQPDKPALIVAHHNPRLGGDPLHFPGGLTDSQSLWQLLAARPQVKAYFHGHIHDRGFAEHRGIHIVNTPATSYVADPQVATTGWTALKLSPHGCRVTTRTNLADHPWNHRVHALTWR